MDKVNYVEMKHVSELAIIGLLLKPFKTWVVPVGSCPGIAAGLITVCGANLSLVSTILIVKWSSRGRAATETLLKKF